MSASALITVFASRDSARRKTSSRSELLPSVKSISRGRCGRQAIHREVLPTLAPFQCPHEYPHCSISTTLDASTHFTDSGVATIKDRGVVAPSPKQPYLIHSSMNKDLRAHCIGTCAKQLTSIILFVLLAANPAQSAPFKRTPQSFKAWLNATHKDGWESGNRIFFESLNGCFDGQNRSENDYTCSNSFIRISDPRGTRICKAYITWEPIVSFSNSDAGDVKIGSGVQVKGISGCRWLKDTRFAD